MNMLTLSARRARLGWAAALAIFIATDVQAAALVVGADYIETRQGACGIPPTSCLVPFAAVPGNKELLVSRVACALHIAGDPKANTIVTMVLGERSRQGATREPHTYLIPVHLATNSTTFQVYQSNNETSHPFVGGMRPQVLAVIFAPGTLQTLNCTLMGKFRDALVP